MRPLRFGLQLGRGDVATLVERGRRVATDGFDVVLVGRARLPILVAGRGEALLAHPARDDDALLPALRLLHQAGR